MLPIALIIVTLASILYSKTLVVTLFVKYYIDIIGILCNFNISGITAGVLQPPYFDINSRALVFLLIITLTRT